MKKMTENKHKSVKLPKVLSEQDYIGKYLDRKLKDNKLHYGLQWLNLYAETEINAQKAYKKYLKYIAKKQKGVYICNEIKL